MIKRNRSYWIEEFHIIFIGRVVSFPTYHIIRAKLTFALEYLTYKLIHDCPLLLFIFKPGSWILKITRICQSICSNRSQLWKSEMASKYLGNPSFDLSFNIHCEKYSSGDNQELSGIYNKSSSEGFDKKSTYMRDDQKISVWVVKWCFSHRLVCRICIDCSALLHWRLACTHQRN